MGPSPETTLVHTQTGNLDLTMTELNNNEEEDAKKNAEERAKKLDKYVVVF